MRLPESLRGERLDRAVAQLLQQDNRTTSVREVRQAIRDGRIVVRAAVQPTAPSAEALRSAEEASPADEVPRSAVDAPPSADEAEPVAGDPASAEPVRRRRGRVLRAGDSVRGGEHVDLTAFVLRAEAVVAADPALLERCAVLFEDDHLLALDKPSGVPTAPLRPHDPGTLLGAAIAHYPAIATAGPPLEGGLLHRLDTPTSGVVVFAKDPETRAHFRAAFSEGRVTKLYVAVVDDPTAAVTATAVATFSLANAGPRVRRVDHDAPGAQAARTELEVSSRNDRQALVEATATTGRRHQIRVHCAELGAPIAGDDLYGDSASAPRLMLHARSIMLPGRPDITAPMPPSFALERR